MRREPWAIANAFAHGVRILNCIFCRHDEEEGWTEDDIEASEEIHWLVAEQINSMCSDMMIDDVRDMLAMVQSIPTGRRCEKTDCRYHHPENFDKHDYTIFKEKCVICVHNSKAKGPDNLRPDYFKPK